MTLPKLEIPSNTWVLYENVAIHNTDRTGNWRFLIGEDGCYFHSRNTELFVDAAQVAESSPDLHWNAPLPDAPIRCFTEEQQNDLTAAIEKATLAAIAPYYTTPPGEEISHPSAERWTIRQGGKTQTIVVENGFAPDALVQLRQTIDGLVAAAPRVTSP